MDKVWMKERIHKLFLLLQTRPFIILILLMIVSPMILRIFAPFFLVFCSVATLTCLGLGTGDFLAFGLKTGEFRFGFNRRKNSSSSSSQVSMHRSSDADMLSTTSWRCEFLHRISLDLLRRRLLAGIAAQGSLTECVDSTSMKSSKQEEEGKNSCVYANHSENDKSIICTHKVVNMLAADNKAHACADSSHHEGDGGESCDISGLENFFSSSEEQEVCKGVLEASVCASTSVVDDDIVLGDPMLQTTANGMKTAVNSAEDDEISIDKHQILPLESCKQCTSKGFHAFEMSSACGHDANSGIHKLKITDAELQGAASEFYTLEGDVLWSESDLKKKPDRGWSSCELCKHGMFPVPSESLSVLPSKACTEATTFAHKPGSAKYIAHVGNMHAQEESRSEGSVEASDMNEDVQIDQELRAITNFRSGNRGEESNYMSTVGSFRDFVGSFRELDACWPEYGMMGRREYGFVTGCCDDHAMPCISHSRSRSKVLQSDPLLSKASLIREQEIMDVLWQEYNDDRRQRYHHLGKLHKENTLTQTLKVGVDSGRNTHEVVDEGNSSESLNVQANEYVMKLHNGLEYGDYDRNNADYCRLGCDKPCWHMAKARNYHRRRHFVGFCRLFRELGLKQCMQSSKVDN